MPGIIEPSVNGYITLSGGTRTGVKTIRPWQAKLQFPKSREECVFCTKKTQTDEHAIARGWKTFQNSNTPFPYHRLLIPTEHWNEPRLRSLGGPDTIQHMFELALQEIIRTGQAERPMWIYPHVGYGAGQNFTHMHCHLCQAPMTPKRESFSPNGVGGAGSVRLWESENFQTFLSGVRAGQSVIRFYSPEGSLFVENPVEQLTKFKLLPELSAEASRLIERFNKKFEDPDYCLMLALNGGSNWHIRYTPILNNWGGSEFAALDYGTPFVLPWRHEDTRDHLLAGEPL